MRHRRRMLVAIAATVHATIVVPILCPTCPPNTRCQSFNSPAAGTPLHRPSTNGLRKRKLRVRKSREEGEVRGDYGDHILWVLSCCVHSCDLSLSKAVFSCVSRTPSVRGQRFSDGTAACSVRNSRPLATLRLRSICNWRDIPHGEGYSTVYGKSVSVSRRMK